TDAKVASLTPASGQVLTDNQGVAIVQIAPATLTVTEAGTLTASAAVGTASVTQSVDFQVTAANLKLQSLDVGGPTLAAYGNRALSVVVTANGAPVTIPVQVTFAASCGVVTPASTTTSATGVATATYSATTAACFGTNVSISASVSGAAPVTGQIAVIPAAATNLQFVSTAPQTIYLSSGTGPTQAIVSFKAVDKNGAAMANQPVTLSLKNTASGVSFDSLGNTSPVTKTTDSSGLVAVAVFAGSIPTSAQIIASASGVTATASNVLTVASGRAVQKAMSMALGKFAIEGASVDGATTTVTVSLADRQGNPVPDGTEVNLTSESGVLVPPTCVTTGGTSSCFVSIRSQGTRPSDGRVSILVHLPGDEDFVDMNSNNVYDLGEPFVDLGDAYRDDNENGAYDRNEFTVPRYSGACSASTIVSANPPDNAAPGDHGRPDHCDGVWGTSDIRRQVVVVFATSAAKITNLAAPASTQLNLGGAAVKVQDLNGNSMPVGSTIAVSSTTSGCTVTNSMTAVPNTYFSMAATQAGLAGTVVPLALTGCAAGNNVTVLVTSPGGLQTSQAFTLN
ncbi:MAG: hypothetical protein JWQ03_1303, partial [Variovorax sp.]|nr:hypothetical protein [Variovorax sp.]